MNKSQLLASLCGAAALSGTWPTAQAAIDNFDLTINLPQGTDFPNIYNARLLYFGYSSHALVDYSQVALLTPIQTGVYEISITRPAGDSWGFALVGSYVGSKAELLSDGVPQQLGMVVGNGSPSVAEFVSIFGVAEYNTAFDILNSQTTTTPLLNTFFQNVGNGALTQPSNINGPIVNPPITIPMVRYSTGINNGNFVLGAAVPETGTWAALGLAGVVVGRW